MHSVAMRISQAIGIFTVGLLSISLSAHAQTSSEGYELVEDLKTVASQEQAQGIEQVNKAISQTDSVIQENATQTEELNATAQMLKRQAEQLMALTRQFQLDQGGGQGEEEQDWTSSVAELPEPFGATEQTQSASVNTSHTIAPAEIQNFEEF